MLQALKIQQFLSSLSDILSPEASKWCLPYVQSEIAQGLILQSVGK